MPSYHQHYNDGGPLKGGKFKIMNRVSQAAVSLIAIPIGFASLSTLWLSRKYHLTGQKPISNLEKYIDFEKNITMNQDLGVKNMWKTYEGIMIILKSARDLLSELLSHEELERFYQLLHELQQKQYKRFNRLNHAKVLILEGLRHSGITTLLQNFVKSSQVRPCPPMEDYLMSLTQKLQHYPISLQNAFTLFCDYYRYALAEDLSIRESCYVVIEKFYHTTCVTQITSSFPDIQDINIETIPSYAFQWPMDLPYPLLVFYFFSFFNSHAI